MAKLKDSVNRFLGGVLLLAYVSAVLLIILGIIFLVDHLFAMTGWPVWVGCTFVCCFWFWLVPRGVDIVLLTPFGVWGIAQGWNLPWTIASIIVAVPVLVVLLFNLGKKPRSS